LEVALKKNGNECDKTEVKDYVHNNPVEAEIAESVEEYLYSSARD